MKSLRTILKNQRKKNQWIISALSWFVILLFLTQPGFAKEKKSDRRRLPPAPDTGSPEEDFSAGGTRDNRHLNTLCGIDRDKIVYLLGNKTREYTSSAHPTFWFHFPKTINKVAGMTFVVTELETGKKIYEGAVEEQKAGITGITLPHEPQYALSSETNYAWSLEIDCARTNGSEIALEGWLSRVSPDNKLKNSLAAVSQTKKHEVYLQHNLLYDALTELGHRRVDKPNNVRLEIAWNQLLTELGWQDLIQQQSAAISICLLPIPH